MDEKELFPDALPLKPLSYYANVAYSIYKTIEKQKMSNSVSNLLFTPTKLYSEIPVETGKLRVEIDTETKCLRLSHNNSSNIASVLSVRDAAFIMTIVFFFEQILNIRLHSIPSRKTFYFCASSKPVDAENLASTCARFWKELLPIATLPEENSRIFSPAFRFFRRNQREMIEMEVNCPLFDQNEISILSIKHKNYVLHSETGPAIEFMWGEKEFEIYCLNGVRVPATIALTPAEELDPHILLGTDNAEVRREIVRKIGIERVCKVLGAETIDKKGDYELILLELGDSRRRPYLKMRNPSLGVYHIEGVHPSCNTVEEALKWRNGSDLEPEVIK
ncbi:MAG: hypothetical protein DRH51_07995 [Candidatus Coatesbacteria bacterium]|nr:MAG: hypothetical protein DRH51_07995 [Candidatus Coatesbacteria bacterium]